jgi:chromosome segregation ATPase
VWSIYTAGIEAVNILTKMQDSTALAGGAEVPPSVIRQIAAERARLEGNREVLRQEREDLEKEKEGQAEAIADLEAQLAAMSAHKADLKKCLLSRETEVKKLRDAGEVPKVKEELNTLREASSKIIPYFLSYIAF